MPGQHKQTKIQKTFWIEGEIYKLLREFLKREKLTLTDFILEAVNKALEEELKKHEKKQ